MTTPTYKTWKRFAALAASFALLGAASTARAVGPGSGQATLSPSGAVVAGSTGSWRIVYYAEEGFPHSSGGVVDVDLPAGWTPPTLTPGQPGEVSVSSPFLSSAVILPPRTIRLTIGDSPASKFNVGDSVVVVYGGGGASGAVVSTAAPDTATFRVLSDPNAGDGVATVLLASGGTLSVPIVPDALEAVRIENAAGAPIDDVSLTADDALHLYLRGYDVYGNALGLVSGAWSVAGGIGALSAANGTDVVLDARTVGSGSVAADIGGTSDATGSIAVAHGAFAALRLTAPAGATAGNGWSVAAQAVDGDGNLVTSGPGAALSIRAAAYADSIGATSADPSFTDADFGLSGGSYSGALIPRRAGTYWVAARDDASGIESARSLLAVAPGAPDHLVLLPTTLALTAGVPGTLTVEARDAFENPAPLLASETLALWSNRPAGSFQSLGGATIYEVAIPAGASSASFRFRDTQSVASGGLVRAIDPGLAPPYLGYGESSVTTTPAAPAGVVALAATPDTLAADGAAAAAIVTSPIADAFGNAVGAGVLVTATGSLVVPAGDADAGTPGVQWATDGAGVVTGSVVAGTTRGAGGVSIASVVGSATGSRPLTLIAGAPAGAVALGVTPNSLVADGASLATASAAGLADANGNPVEDGERYTVSTSGLATIATADADAGTPGVQVAASSGAVSFAVRAGTVVGPDTLRVVSVRGSAAGAAVATFTTGGVDAAQSLVTAASPAAVGPVGSVVTVTLRDAQGHPLADVPAASISLAVTGVPAMVTPLAAATDASGALGLRVTTTLAATASIAATALGVPLAAAPSILFTPGSVDHYTVTGPAPPLLAGRADTLRVTARDLYENAAPAAGGSRMSVRVLGGVAVVPDTVAFAGAFTDVPFTPTATTSLTIQVREVVPPLRSASYGPASVSPAGPYALDSLAVAATTLAAGDSTTVDAWVTDEYGNAQPGAAVAATVIAGGGSIAPASALTDAAGRARLVLHAGGTLGSLAARLAVVGSPAPDAVRADTAAVAVVSGPAASIDIAHSTGGIVAGGLLSVMLTLRDAFGNVAIGATPLLALRTTTPTPSLDNVRWSTTGAAAGVLADSASSDGASYQFTAADSGTATLAVRDTLAETIQLRASGPGLPLAQTAPVTIQPAPATQLAVVSGDAQSGVVADTLALPLRVRARDSFGNVAPGTVVRFAVTGGGGAIDALLGGAVDGDVVADASGLARCDVWTLGAAAGAGNAARASLVATPSTFVGFTATALPDTATTLALAPGVLLLSPTQTGSVTATARDAYGNAVPGVPLTFYLAGPPPVEGTLQSIAGATTGGPGSQTGSTDALGRVPVRYAASSSAPAVDSLYVRSASLAPVGIRVSVSVGTTASLRVTADSLSWIAGSPVRLRVEPLDAQGNVVTDDAGTAAMRPVAGVSFAPTSGPLLGGVFQTFATSTVAGSIASVGADRSGSPGVGGATGPVTVRPSTPSGAIPVSATRTTLTADGRSLATVTFGPVRDAYGNLAAPGSALVASATAGSLAATSLATDAAGLASTVLVAPNTAGPGTVDVVSTPAGASGSLNVTFVPPPTLTAAAASVAPTVVLPGSTVTFQADVTNTGSGSLTLGGGTTFSFGPSGGAVSAPLAGAPVAVPAGATRTLTFAATALPGALAPGSYAPTLRAVGTDLTGDPFDFYPSLGGALVHVAGALVAAVGAAPSTAPLGYADLQLTFDVTNLSGADGVVESASLAFSQGTFTVNGVAPALPAALPALSTRRLTISVRVPSSGIADGAVVNATMTAGTRYGAVTVAASNTAPLPVTIVTGASLGPVAGGTTPARLLRGRRAAPTVSVRNTGTADVTLFKDLTVLAFGNGAGDSLLVPLLANQVVAGGDAATLVFDSLAVPGTIPLGLYGATLRFRGSEAGQPYARDVAADPATMPVVDPARLAVASLAPDTVSAGQTRALRLTVANTGGVAYDLGAASTLTLGAPVSTTLAIAAPVTLPAGGSAPVDFTAAPIGIAASPGSAAARLDARGFEDGVARDENVAAGTLVARPPAALAYVAGSASPDTVRAGQTVLFTAAIRNDGGSPFLLDPAATRVTVSDGVETAAAFAAGAPFLLAPGAQAALVFPSLAFPAALASQPYPVTLDASGSEWGVAASATLVSPAGELRVVEPAAALQVAASDPGAPTQTAPGSGPLRLWNLTFDPLVPVGGSSSTRLESVALTVLLDGSPAGSPAAVVTAIEARDGSGALLAQAPAAASGPLLLTFAPPLDLSAGPVTFAVDVTLVPGLEARDVGLRLAAEGDVVARDNLSGTRLPVRAPGGLPFQPLDSRRVTLFAKAHGYPNPFRVGQESILLSYRLADDASVRVRIVTLLGDLVREISIPAGAAGGVRGLNEVPWDGRNGAGREVQPGVYVARIEGSGVNETIKVGVRR